LAGVTEVQPGSYIFMDREYLEIGGAHNKIYDDFLPSLSVLTTVVSVPTLDRVVVDAGMKALSTDAGPAAVLDLPHWEYAFFGDEHGMLFRRGPGPQPRVGDVIRLIPGHCDTTVNLYDYFHVIREGKLVAVWEIVGRGRTQ
jgi:D-serine deaminase-like pyridoxal phosphate-dependent protein